MLKKYFLPMELQIFADSQPPETNPVANPKDLDPQDVPDDQGDTSAEEDSESSAKIDELMAEIASLKVESQKNKNALDKALKEKAEVKRRLAQKQTAEEKEDEARQAEKEAHDEEFARLQEFEKKALAKERYLIQGMSGEMAEKAAKAEVEGDMDALSEIQKQHLDTRLKEARADWQKSIPQPNFGTGEYSSMTKEEIMAIKDTDERVRAIAKNQHLFKTK